jgi:hypothetical protein
MKRIATNIRVLPCLLSCLLLLCAPALFAETIVSCPDEPEVRVDSRSHFIRLLTCEEMETVFARGWAYNGQYFTLATWDYAGKIILWDEAGSAGRARCFNNKVGIKN